MFRTLVLAALLGSCFIGCGSSTQGNSATLAAIPPTTAAASSDPATSLCSTTSPGPTTTPTPPVAGFPFDRIVVIYQENHSFDNLYGSWEGVNGLSQADSAHTAQVDQNGKVFDCLLQTDVNLSTPALAGPTCHFPNAPFAVDSFILPDAKTCLLPGIKRGPSRGVPDGHGAAGGCTRDLTHAFYQAQYQLDGGKLDRFVTASNAAGLTMGVYATQSLPIYKFLHEPGHPSYAIADNFFQAAFGGSFLNHQWLIAAKNPEFPNALNDGSKKDLHSIVDANGMPASYALYKALSAPVKDSELTVSCNPPATSPPTPPGVLCGDYAVNTILPTFQPTNAASSQLPPQNAPTIGDRLSAADIDWAWYSGGWSNAAGRVGEPGWTNGAGPNCADPNSFANPAWPNCPDYLFQFHHQPFNFYAPYAPGTRAREEHLRDQVEFQQLVDASSDSWKLKPVSFIKFIGRENEHPGYASQNAGDKLLVNLLKSITTSSCANNTLIIVTYDEFGGQWDHVPPPGQGDTPGPHDAFGPGARIPTLILSPYLQGPFVVDHTQYDTTSIAATIEHRFSLAPLSERDAKVQDLTSVFKAAPAE